VLRRSEQSIAKDRAIRAEHEERLRADIDTLTQRIANERLVDVAKINQAIGRLKERYSRAARYFDLTYDQGTLNAEFDADKHLHAERLDGCYTSAQDQPKRPVRRRALADIRPAHARRERLS
jgi:hypothetical protein